MCFSKIKSISLGQVFSAEIKHLKIECEKEINWQIFWMKKKREEKFKFKDLALGLIFSKENQQLKMEYEKEIIC